MILSGDPGGAKEAVKDVLPTNELLIFKSWLDPWVDASGCVFVDKLFDISPK